MPEGWGNAKSWPVPLSATGCGLPAALSVNDRLPDAAPVAVGVNVTATVQVPAAATGVEVEQVVPEVAMAKGAAAVIALRVRLRLPVLVRVTLWELLVVASNWAAKVSVDGDKLTWGPPVATDRLKVLVTELTPLPLAVMVIVWLLTSGALLAATSEMLPEVPVPGWVIVAVTPLGKVLVESVTLPV